MIDAPRVRILSTAGLNQSQIAQVKSVSSRIELIQAETSSDTFEGCLAGAEILLIHWSDTGFDPASAPELRWIQLNTASVENVFSQPVMGTDVTITNASGIHAVPIAEYVLTSMLAFTRHLPELLHRQAIRHWSRSSEVYADLVSDELRASTLGVLGYGSIGREIGRLGHCFGMRVLASKRNPAVRKDSGWHPPGVGDPEGTIPAAFYGPEQLHQFLSTCDYVAIACPLTPATEGIIDENALKVMRPHAYLVNIARGGLIVESALVTALREGWIGGAGLDVTATEPLPATSPLFDLPNVILTPHCSGTTSKYNERLTDLFCANLRHYLAGEPLINVVNRTRRY